ncbi:MAG: hypothetical protein HLUCCO16_15700 [Phormidium sp. OSCR]|nr:MAG: hypothetical protein HLUCCO16_15700 [Phormidium sp. OSCR]
MIVPFGWSILMLLAIEDCLIDTLIWERIPYLFPVPKFPVPSSEVPCSLFPVPCSLLSSHSDQLLLLILNQLQILTV